MGVSFSQFSWSFSVGFLPIVAFLFFSSCLSSFIPLFPSISCPVECESGGASRGHLAGSTSTRRAHARLLDCARTREVLYSLHTISHCVAV